MSDHSARRRLQEEFLKLLADNELPPPDEIWWEPESTVMRWHEPRVVIHLDPDGDDGPDAVQRAIVGDVALGDWPGMP